MTVFACADAFPATAAPAAATALPVRNVRLESCSLIYRRLRFCTYFFIKLRLSRKTGILISAAVADDCDSLNFDQHAGLREARNGDERAARIAALPERFLPDFNKSITEA